MSSSGSSKDRLLIVHVKSADIYTKNKGPFYVKLSFRPEEKLETRCVFHGGLVHATWNQRFVFVIPQTALTDGKSSVKFQIFRKNSFLNDSLVGELEVKLDGFEVDEKISDDIDEVKYDSANDLSESEDEEETEKREEFPELKKRVSVEMKKAKLEVGMVVSKVTLNRVGKGSYWRGFAMDYEEFLGNKQDGLEGKNKKINVFLMCLKA